LHFLMAGWLMSTSKIAGASSGRCKRKFSTPGGNPASRNSEAMR
jgi:hypothetical protein